MGGIDFRANLVLGFSLITLMAVAKSEAKLKIGFYRDKCPEAESIVKSVIEEALKTDSGLAADFLRMHFHDCFVRGCDASILLDSTEGNKAEKDSPVNNPSLEGFDVIDKIKAELEDACCGVVSCADIIAFSARDSYVLSGGHHYEVPSGRRDGRVSRSEELQRNLPFPHHNLTMLTKIFARKHLTYKHLVVLSGAHTIGKAACQSFDNRLYSFSQTTKQDPSIDPSFARQLKQQCHGGPGDANVSVQFDSRTPEFFDANYFRNVISHKVVFTSDQSLLSSSKTARRVAAYARDDAKFRKDFATAMVRMGKIGIKTGDNGEIRHNCRVVNSS